ncbi:hypothetical protein [Hoeflea sp. TYP-13]|uniref:hypothetical protein n=1 Tax=Hoeflea sp. TYP-13 TaxID=3230023 RepID=UPI0034C6C20E
MPDFVKRLLPIVFLLDLLSGAAADDASPFSGVWTGTGFQGEHSWSMRVTFAPEEVRIEYPSLECGGTWVPASRNSKHEGEAFFHERLEYGHQACFADGFVRIRTTPSGIDYEWSRSAGSLVEATASLRREPN